MPRVHRPVESGARDAVRGREPARGGHRGGRWEQRLASIVVTRQSVFIHKNKKVGLELTPRTRREVEVRRDGERIRITAGSGRAAESWSFVPPDNPEHWARDMAVFGWTFHRWPGPWEYWPAA